MAVDTLFVRRLTELLRLDTQPVGVKLYRRKEELPRRPYNWKVNICQLVCQARYRGKFASGTPDLMICAIGAACTGLIRTPDRFTSGQAAVGRYVADLAAGRKFMANTYKLGDRGKLYEGIYVGPLVGFKDGDPDVVVIYANPAQVMRLIHASVFETGEAVKADTVAEAALCSSIGFALGEQKPVIGFPCAGDRTFGGTQKDELLFALPFSLFQTVVENLESLQMSAGQVYPVGPFMNWTPSMVPAYTLTPEDLEEGK
ncbi:DUF169 domain-containing protein [Thermanaeromonas sp. C210]|uniref:DUF169 domain-containing protein n=1 Tax=Thermanaeromonas sp. C210 TaxID=2731925 RepID=UPI00155C9147|nr:DUF169 domain-containing protein [Thermanaeromonas sp. C210]GFN22222.1 hypothetical protein TAMC210_05380 [Thermanaeromonas sp. C210]